MQDYFSTIEFALSSWKSMFTVCRIHYQEFWTIEVSTIKKMLEMTGKRRKEKEEGENQVELTNF